MIFRPRLRATRRDDGWTLIEMLVVLSLIMILSSLALTQYRSAILSAKEAADKEAERDRFRADMRAVRKLMAA